MAWYWHAVEFASGFLFGVLIMAVIAMGRCGECEIIARIRRGGDRTNRKEIYDAIYKGGKR